MGAFQPHLLIALAIVFILIFAAICFGVRWLGKVVVFTFSLPVCLLAILLVRTLFLNGALAQFERLHSSNTDWTRLADPVCRFNGG